MRRRSHSDDDDFDENGLIRDRGSLHVPMYFMDADAFDPVQRAIARSTTRVVDAQGGTQGLHRPGWRLSAADARKVGATSDAVRARDAAYLDYERDLVNAYKNPVGLGSDPTGFGSHGAIGQRVPDRADAAPKDDDGDERECPACAGSGLDYNSEECQLCHGTGFVPADYEGNEDLVFENTETHHEGLRRRRVDSRSVQQVMRDHQIRMHDEYSRYDEWLRTQFLRGNGESHEH